MIWLSSQKSQVVAANKSDKDRKIGHRRVDDAGQVTYKRVSTCCLSRGVGSINAFVCLSICLSVCLHNSKTTWPNFTKLLVHIAYGRGPLFLWRLCDTLMCFRSDFVDAVMFSRNCLVALMCIMCIPK